MFFLLYIALVGLVAGWAAGKIMKGSGYGLLMDLLLGVVGAMVGHFVLGLVGLYSNGDLVPNILVAIVGAVIVVAVARALKKT
jgi:uncharacterized membrane protein YeaQ/YmgE (transglycosylase-associated protein family)